MWVHATTFSSVTFGLVGSLFFRYDCGYSCKCFPFIPSVYDYLRSSAFQVYLFYFVCSEDWHIQQTHTHTSPCCFVSLRWWIIFVQVFSSSSLSSILLLYLLVGGKVVTYFLASAVFNLILNCFTTLFQIYIGFSNLSIFCWPLSRIYCAIIWILVC